MLKLARLTASNLIAPLKQNPMKFNKYNQSFVTNQLELMVVVVQQRVEQHVQQQQTPTVVKHLDGVEILRVTRMLKLVRLIASNQIVSIVQTPSITHLQLIIIMNKAN